MKKIGMKKMVGARKRGAPVPKMMAIPKAMKPMAMEGQMPMEGPMAGPMGMKKGGSVKKMAKGGDIVGKGKTPAAARMDYEKKMKAAGKKPLPAAKAPKGPGIGIMIILGKKKGK